MQSLLRRQERHRKLLASVTAELRRRLSWSSKPQSKMVRSKRGSFPTRTGLTISRGNMKQSTTNSTISAPVVSVVTKPLMVDAMAAATTAPSFPVSKLETGAFDRPYKESKGEDEKNISLSEYSRKRAANDEKIVMKRPRVKAPI
ncbi:hypothetical protein PENTCL1PPCAC_5765 [Pristionchus entomophagus]|uniref:Uncharacterized protein n=1 Tax=Pristionchus entomophagus TaxID=358040 RepID=A0AAV5SM47_9BILA|nr:hypothetical protein PENTCL1PPCAC_5765 [Pristionchus entomophagus]